MKYNIKPLFQRSMQPLLAATILLLANISADAAAYIKFDGIDGESSGKDHKGWSDLVSFSVGASREDTADTASGMPKLNFKQFVVAKKTDSASPKLMEALCTGRFFPSIVIELTEETADGTEETYYRYELKNVFVTSYSVSGGSSEAPAEEFSLNWEEIKAIHKKGKIEASWKVEEGSK